ncbi:MAG: PilN domain-containing protein [Gammaproteobacteria bacterium]|nr:PilN domain-containing protein [Gammaproteobacteria bacterium]
MSFRVLLQGSGAVLLLLVLMFGWSQAQTWQIKANLASIKNQFEHQNAKFAVLDRNLAAMNVDTAPQKELAKLEQELVALQKVVDALTQVRKSYTRGVSGYMESFSRQAPKGVWLTGFSVKAGGDEVVIRGSSLKPALVPLFIQQLSVEPTLSGTHFGLLQIQREQSQTRYVDFTVYTGNEPPEEVAQ